MGTDKSKDKHCDYNNFKRARYFHGMLLTDRDFREEQMYHNEKRKLLNKMLHGWGVVCGLDIQWEKGKSAITIKPGMALDCHGNEIVVCEPCGVDLASVICKTGTVPAKKPMTSQECEKLGTQQSNTFYVGVRYKEVPTDPVPVYAPGGGCEEKVCEYSRIREGFCVKIFDHDHPPQQPQGKSISPSLIKRFFDNCHGEAGFWTIQRGNAQDGGGSQIILSQGASDKDNFYNGMQIQIRQGTDQAETKTITGYNGESRTATVDSNWVVAPDGPTPYLITNEECLRKEVRAFGKDFCEKSIPCPDCCPEEHYLVLGTVEIDPVQKTINKLILDGNRTYVPTIHLFRYLFASLLNGADTYFEVSKKDGTTEALPDVNLIHTNPLKALCWLGSMFIEQADLNQNGVSILGHEKVPVKPPVLPEVEKLRKEIEALKKTVAELGKKPQRKAPEK